MRLSLVLPLAAALGLIGLGGGPAASRAEPAESPLKAPMRFVRVHANNRECQPYCPEWISAEGKIEVGTAPLFADTIAALGGRRLPVVVNSGGGSAVDAARMGRLIRANGLAVVVARTVLDPCSPAGTTCGEAPGAAMTAGAVCASACTLLLAAGVERYASHDSHIGLHRAIEVETHVTQHFKVLYRIHNGVKEEVSRTLVSEDEPEMSKQDARPEVETNLEAYLEDMGVGAGVGEVMRATPPESIHWMTSGEMAASRMVTIWIDRPSPILVGGGANGLAGVPVDPSSGHDARVATSMSAPLSTPGQDEPLKLEAGFLFLRGGGTIEARFTTRDAAGAPIIDSRDGGLVVAFSPGSSYRLSRPGNGAPIRVTIPRASFCAFSPGERILIRPFNDRDPPAASANAPTIGFDLNANKAMGRLASEACGAPATATP